MKTRKQKVRRSNTPSRSRNEVIEASALGVAQEHIAGESQADYAGMPADLAPPYNLPMAAPSDAPVFSWRQIASPLVPARTSFWLGVGFGMIVVGMLMIMVWQFVRVDVAEALVLGFGR